MPSFQGYLSVPTVARLTGRSRQAVLQWIKRGRVEATRIGRAQYVGLCSLLIYLGEGALLLPGIKALLQDPGVREFLRKGEG